MSDYNIIINNRDMTFNRELFGGETIYSLPTLSAKDKLGRSSYWKILVSEDDRDVVSYHSESWIEGGKVKKSEKTIIEKGKNIGKKNETNALQQALFESYSRFLKKKDQEFSVVNENKSLDNEIVGEEIALNENSILPMLAQKYNERKKYLIEPFGVSPKLDGIRMMASLDKNGGVVLRSRTGKEFLNMKLIREQVSSLLKTKLGKDIVLDGEVYSHDIPFNVISGATRSKQESECDSLLEYWIFDIADVSLPYKERINLMKKLQDEYHSIYKLLSDCRLKFVWYEPITHDQIKKAHDHYVSEGFEGIILRNLDSVYHYKIRSNDCQKYKEFEDKEFKIVGFKDGRGSELGAIIFECETLKGEVFDVRIRGSIESRKDMYKNGGIYIGKKLTVRYQNTENEKDCVPRFPIGIEIRDYE